ncbi:ABC transporter ATP-binding protein [Capsulimonas corticalis]|uniref:ABC transporter ATP-binding protein n=1 Tax=Capsulimonas corticalis TaxID=2219043 RepID=A0A402CPR0_9BACT|nr:ABC transporter ATP-binding protein [Capsulimonas corticalis]BDI32989.1 ABC transporter ATP-binding protein [Capsulimonas corticalis]
MIRIEKLRKEYKGLTAVKDLDLNLEAGDIFGFIGPNGAGKTTTIKMLATLLKPSSGKAYIDNVDVVANPEAVRERIGYMPAFFGIYDDMRVWEYLDFFASAYRLPRNDRPRIIDDVLNLTDLIGKKDNYVEELSTGMKQRLCLAKTLIHDPKVLLLDEPASGLDPRARIEIKELFKELKAMGKTIIISSHILPELADFCNKVGIIERGEMLISGDVQEIMSQVAGGKTLEIRILGDIETAAEATQSLPGVRAVRTVDSRLHVDFNGDLEAQADLNRLLVEKGLRILSFSEQQTDLEDIFMKVTRGLVQ